MRIRTLAWILSALTVAAAGPQLHAGGNLETINITNAPSPAPGFLTAETIGIRWDLRALPIRYRVNNTLDPIPNPLGAPVLTLDAAIDAFKKSMKLWNDIPTSYIAMEIVGTTANGGQRGFDMKNELTFRTQPTFSAIAFSPSTSLIEDATLVDGDDIDGDGDSDVSSAISTASDVDGDEDIEFPAGFYKAGTILDNDVAYNTKAAGGLRFTVGDENLDTVVFSVDFTTVTVHELGHSFGLSHSLENQNSITDGTGATMFPFIDTGDPASELAQRTPDTDDVAWASYLYPEGTAKSGLPALQRGDFPFSRVFGLITGDATHGAQNRPLVGGNVYAINLKGRRVASGFSGVARLAFQLATGSLFFFTSPDVGIVNGHYTIPVPLGLYTVGIEPLDGNPAAGGNISFSGQVGAFYGQQNFTEELFNRRREAAIEDRADERNLVLVLPGRESDGIDIITNDTLHINNFGSQNSSGFLAAPPGRLYAVRIPASQIAAAISALGGEANILAANLATNTADASVPVKFAEALFTTGTVDGTGEIVSINLTTPIVREAPFQAEENDLTPWFFRHPRRLGRQVADLIAAGSADQFFLVLRVPTVFQGVSNVAPLIGIDGPTNVPATPNDVPNFGVSYHSDDGGVTWVKRLDWNFRFGLALGAIVPPPSTTHP